MRFKVVLSLISILFAAPVWADQYHVYDAKDSLVVGRYIVQDKRDGSKFVYDATDSLIIPKYVVKPIPNSNSWHLYDPSKSTIILKSKVEGGEVK